MKYAKYYFTFFSILLYTGLRISEMLGLTWHDIDFKKKELSINHQLLQRSIDGCLKHYCTIGAKTESGIRIIPLSDNLIHLF